MEIKLFAGFRSPRENYRQSNTLLPTGKNDRNVGYSNPTIGMIPFKQA